MQKTINIVWKVVLGLIILGMLITCGYLYINRDEIVTSKITMNYFVETVESNDKERMKSFIADSNNDVLYTNFVSTMNNIYYYEGVADLNFEITDKKIYGNGERQCYLANAFEDYVTKCDMENKGRYVNYLVDINVKYSFNGETMNRKEKGLVVFVKDMVNGNYFTWKLVRFDRYKVEG